MQRGVLVATSVLLGAGAIALVGAQPEQAIGVNLGLSQEFYYAGDPLELSISVRNAGPAPLDNPLRSPLLSGFKVRPRGGTEPFAAKGEAGITEPDRPKSLAPGAFYGTALDIGRLYPELRTPGTFEIYWGADKLISNMLLVTIIERFDPKADYAAEIVTSQGSIVIDLYEGSAPIATRAFVDMARTGVYDGMTIHEAHRDDFIVGGDPLVTPGRRRRTVQFPAELAPVPIVAGSVVLKPVNPAPMANGSIFMIALRPQPEWNGQVTVLGQVTKGLDVVRTLSQVPTTARTAQPYWKPLDEVLIQRVTILERPAGEGGAPPA